MNSPTQSTRSSVTACSKPGCSDPANGVAPFGYCTHHFRSYQEWLARRGALESYVADCVTQLPAVVIESALASREQSPLGRPSSSAKPQERERALVGAVMDEIAHHGVRSVYRSRPKHSEKDQTP